MTTTYTLTLTPKDRSMSSEGYLDTAVIAATGLSIQRTGYINVPQSGKPGKTFEVVDGGTFTDDLDTITSYPGVVIA